MFNKLPSDVWFEKLDPVLKLWLYESWCRDLEEQNEFARSYAILQGSFTNPDLAHKMIKSENPDFETSDEDFEKVSQQIIEQNKKEDSLKHRRRRKTIVNQ
jgi:hypothetical protein